MGPSSLGPSVSSFAELSSGTVRCRWKIWHRGEKRNAGGKKKPGGRRHNGTMAAHNGCHFSNNRKGLGQLPKAEVF